jgi:uncharacterized protein YlxP (DUF503 family)
MYVGAIMLELLFPGCHSLKEKRQALKSIVGKVRAKFNVAVAEVDHQDLWQRGTIGIACVSQDSYQAKILIHKIRKFIEDLNKAEIIEEKTTLFSPEQ